MANTVIVTPCSPSEAREHQNTPLNACSHLSLDRNDGAFPSLAELRKQSVIDIAVTVSHIRALCLLEAGI